MATGYVSEGLDRKQKFVARENSRFDVVRRLSLACFIMLCVARIQHSQLQLFSDLRFCSVSRRMGFMRE